MELDSRTSSLRALELEEEARTTLAQQMGQQLSSNNGEEVHFLIKCILIHIDI
jgi:hypothetical protein